MAGYIIPVVPKRSIAFGILEAGTTQDVILADRVDLLHWREVNLTVHVHQLAIPGDGSIIIGAIAQSWTSAEPETTFLGTEFMLDPITVNTSSPTLITGFLSMNGGFPSGCMSAMARLIARGIGEGDASMSAVISVEFAVKDA